MALGVVKFFNETKGFGFIQPNDGGSDVFVHITAVRAADLGVLHAGQRVTFEVITERGRPAAGNLSPDFDRLVSLGEHIRFVQPEPEQLVRPASTIERLLAKAKRGSNLLAGLTPAEFEIFARELLELEGMTAYLVSQWNQKDGGADIVAVRKSENGLHTVFAVQCKHSKGPIGVDVLRGLYAVLDRFKAHQGVVMTSSHFTKDAKAERFQYYSQVSFRDYANIVQSMRRLGLVADNAWAEQPKTKQ